MRETLNSAPLLTHSLNNNNNTQVNVYGVVIITESIREFTRFIFDECRTAPSGCDRQTKPTNFGP